MKYIAYYRVSTQRQGQSGLGLEAQEAIVKAFIKPEDEIMLSFTEVESRRKDNRPELLKAIEACKQCKATLLLANMTRLTGNAAFFFTLRDSGLPLKFADMPEADEFVIGIMALLAERETKVIRKRIKDALAAKKARNEPMGTPKNLTGGAKGSVANHKKFLERMAPIKPLILYFLKQGDKEKDIYKKFPEFYPHVKRPFLDRAVKLTKKEYEATSSEQ